MGGIGILRCLHLAAQARGPCFAGLEAGQGARQLLGALQVDVPNGKSGLLGLEPVLAGIEGLTFVHLSAADVVRHRIVADIVAAYERTGDAEQDRARG